MMSGSHGPTWWVRKFAHVSVSAHGSHIMDEHCKFSQAFLVALFFVLELPASIIPEVKIL